MYFAAIKYLNINVNDQNGMLKYNEDLLLITTEV